MLVLFLTACMYADTKHCQEQHLTIYDDITPNQCMVIAQAELAQWSEAHPSWYVKEWKCGYLRFTKA